MQTWVVVAVVGTEVVLVVGVAAKFSGATEVGMAMASDAMTSATAAATSAAAIPLKIKRITASAMAASASHLSKCHSPSKTGHCVAIRMATSSRKPPMRNGFLSRSARTRRKTAAPSPSRDKTMYHDHSVFDTLSRYMVRISHPTATKAATMRRPANRPRRASLERGCVTGAGFGAGGVVLTMFSFPRAGEVGGASAPSWKGSSPTVCPSGYGAVQVFAGAKTCTAPHL